MKYFSQYKQDQYLNENVFKNKTTGFFLDIGASHPKELNNTYFFENLGWDGVLVEPRLCEYNNLKKERKSPAENVGIYNESGTFKFLECEGYISALSGILKEQHPQHLNRIFHEFLMYGSSMKIIDIKTITFDDLMTKYNKTYVDYMSLDTEGSELSILTTINFSKYKIKAISVENNYNNNSLDNFLVSMGYKKLTSLGCDDIYINDKA